MLAGVLAGPLGLDSSGARLLYAIAIVVGGYSTLRAAWMSLRTRSLDMNVLMTLAVAGAAATGEWFEGASVVALFSIGNLLQASAMERTRGTIRGLMELAPRVAHVRRGRGDYDVPVENVPLHETVLVRPGERIPMDGEVIGGSSSVNESSITGESLPAEKGRGDAVYAGTLNQGGALEVMVTRVFRETTLARIIHRVEEAQAQRAPAQLTIDRFARVYTPFVTLLALLVAVGPPASLWTWCALHDATMLPWVWADWFQRGLALLLVACPCALVISTPVAIVTAIGTASRNGVLIKGGAYLEAISDLKVMLYDKTGTLTTGEFELEDIVPLGNESCNRMLMVAAALESRSEHPLAQAFLQSVRRRKLIDLPIVSGFQSLAGFGIEGTIDGQTWRLGCPRLLERAGVSIEAARSVVARVEGLGRTAILLAKETEPTGVFVLADQPREEVKRTIDELRNLGIRRQCMITGDNAGVARSVSAQAGLDEYKACLLPEQKLELVKEFRRQAGPVGMVGDGVNDAPALASAEVGLVMGAAGSDTAMETADVALMGDDLSRLPYLIRLSRKTRSVVRQNIAVSIASKSVLVVAAVFVGIPLWLAVLGDVGVSLLVTLNSLRLSSDRGAACAADSRRALQEARAPA
jgi:Cd2+/Zn2+-exporting ATPase